MSLSHHPSIVKNGLVFYSDPANFKSYPSSQDPYINQTVLMLNGENITDYSLNQTALTNNGTVTVSSAQYKVGGNSLSFNGASNTSYLNATTTSAIVFGTGDFTIEFWIYFNSVANTNIVDQRDTASNQLAISLYLVSTLRYFTNGADRITGPVLSTGVWYHIALSRVSSNTRMFVNGSQVGSTYADTNNYVGPNFCIGGYRVQPVANLDGYMDEFRVTKAGRYSSNFTPQTTPFDLPSTSIDLTKNKYSMTYVSGVTFSSLNGGTMALNGTSGSGIINNVLNVGPTSAFSICTWAKWNTTATTGGARRPAVGISTITNSFEFALGFPYTYSASKLGIEVGKAGVASQIGYSINSTPTGVWYHLAGVYKNGSCDFYLNGQYQSSITYSATINGSTTASGNWLIGTELFNGTTSANTIGPMNGNVGPTQVYNRSITSSEVFQNYNATKSRYGY
jgi:hypothetical protein